MEIKKRRRVLLCSPIGKGGTGGIARWTQHILNYIRDNSSEVDLQHYYVDMVIRSYTNSLQRIYYGMYNYSSFLFGLIKKLKSGRFDSVHICTSASFSLLKDLLSIRIIHKYNCEAIIHFHFGRIPDLFEQHNWERKFLEKVIMLADKVIVIDKRSYNTLLQQGYKNIYLLPNPLAPRVAELINKNVKIQREQRKIVFVGHVVKTKGVFELIDACNTISDIEVELIGAVSEKMYSELVERAHKKDWLKILGEHDTEFVIKEMLSAAVFVLPTYTEGFPNVIIESMACGCPIVTTCVGAIPEMLDNENGENFGICVEPKNVQQLKGAIERMLNEPDFAYRCGKNAQNRVKRMYSMSQVWNQLVGIWND